MRQRLLGVGTLDQCLPCTIQAAVDGRAYLSLLGSGARGFTLAPVPILNSRCVFMARATGLRRYPGYATQISRGKIKRLQWTPAGYVAPGP